MKPTRPVTQLRGAGPTDVCPQCRGLVVRGLACQGDWAEAFRLRCTVCTWHRYMLPVLAQAELVVADTRVEAPYIPGVCSGCGEALPVQHGPGRRRRSHAICYSRAKAA